MKRTWTAVLLIVMCVALSGYPVKITSWQIADDVKRLNELHASVDYVNSETQTIIAYVPGDELFNVLLANGFKAEKIADAAKDYADALWSETMHSDDPMRAYYSWTEFTNFMQATAIQYPNICQLVQFGSSVQNRPLYFIKVSDNVTLQENEPEFRYISSIHGDEVVGYDMLIRLIQLLTTQYGTNPRITNIVNNTELWICPMLNPDGYVAGERYNANGADLNRNFPLPVGSQHPDGMAWQPETIAVMNLSNTQYINLSANFHGGALVANYPWDYTYTLAPDNDLLIQAALSYASHNTDMYNSTEFPQGITNGAAWYVALGTMQDWFYGYNSSLDITMEVGYNKWPASTQLDSYWSQNQESLLSMIEFVQKGLHGTVTSSTGSPLDATITINTPGVNIKTDPRVGDYHRMLLPGTYTVTAYAVGYQSASVEVMIPANTAVTHDFVLIPELLTDFSGVVVNLAGNPVVNAIVKLIRATTTILTTTNASGAFSFGNIAQDEYMVNITAPGYGVYNNSFVLGEQSNKQIFVLPDPIFFDDFENGLSNWTIQSPWAIATQNINHVLTDSPSGNYSNNITRDATLSSPVSLLNYSNISLSFDISYNLEPNYDFLYVYASNNGTSWTLVTSFTGVSSAWQNQSFSLNNYAGSNLYLRFRISTDNSVNADGVYIDNVMISGLSTVQTVYGDTDANWMVNLLDVQNILEYSVGNNPIPQIDSAPWEAFRLEAADVDNDNQITATDAYYIYKTLQQYLGPFPAQSGTTITFSNPQFHIDLIDSDRLYYLAEVPQNMKALTINLPDILGFEVQNVVWNDNITNVLTAMSLDNHTLSLINFGTDTVETQFLQVFVDFTTTNTITATGLINDVPFSQVITNTANEDEINVIYKTQLIGNFPNPFNPDTTIRFTLEKDNTPAKLMIYNTKGQLVKTLVDTSLGKGSHKLIFDGRDNDNNRFPNGVYFYRLITPEKTFTNKMVILK